MVTNAHISKRYLAWTLLPFCVFLISMGMGVPDPANQCSTPKPRPRAVIQIGKKITQVVTVQKATPAAEPTEEIHTPLPPQGFQTFYSYRTCQFRSVIHRTEGARAPPQYNS